MAKYQRNTEPISCLGHEFPRRTKTNHGLMLTTLIYVFACRAYRELVDRLALPRVLAPKDTAAITVS